MEQLIFRFIAGYLLVMSVFAFILMGIDKRRAEKGAWRISEKTLLLAAVLGGGIGSFLGMNIFRHKTRHLSFRILLPASAVVYAVVLYNIFRFINQQ